jgi:DNA-binding CsgD family transcriptional regulator
MDVGCRRPSPARLFQLLSKKSFSRTRIFAAPSPRWANQRRGACASRRNIGSLFVYTAPRFHFSRSERVLLQHALMGETCEQLAASLSLSPWTVKKRWHAICDRVAAVDGELLPPPIAYGAHASSRGAERRRHLLNYLRQHLEELRPYKPPRRPRGTARIL